MSSDLLDDFSAETEKRNQEHLQLRKEDAHRTGNSCRRCCRDGDIKSSADGCWAFFCVTATVGLHLFDFFLFCFRLFLHSARTAAKISFAELFHS